jgi:hypothetical protein
VLDDYSSIPDLHSFHDGVFNYAHLYSFQNTWDVSIGLYRGGSVLLSECFISVTTECISVKCSIKISVFNGVERI